MEVINVDIKDWNYKERTYIATLTLSNMHHVRMECKENPLIKQMEPLTLSIMNGSCPCCTKPTCSSLQDWKDKFFKQVLKIRPNAKEFAAGNLRVLMRDKT